MLRRVVSFHVVLLLAGSASLARASVYYSQGSLAPHLVSSWSSDRGGAGTSPADFAAADTFVVQAGHAMSTTAAWTVTGAGARLSIEGGGSLTANHIVGVPAFQIDDGGTYVHNAASGTANGVATDIPGSARTFGAASTVEIRKWANGGTAPVALPAVTWGHLKIDVATLAGNWSQAGNLQVVNGDLGVVATGGRQFRLTGGGTRTVEVHGNYTQSGGTVTFAAAAGTITLAVDGDFALGGGSFSMAEAISVSSTLSLGGDFTHTAGILTENGDTGGLVLFRGSGVQVFTSGGTVSQTISWRVNAGATLATNTSTVTGGGTFTLQSGARLMIGSPNGISASSASGNIQTSGSRSFSTGAEYVYNGASAQITGTGLPATVAGLGVDKATSVALTNSVTVTGSLALTSGELSVGVKTLTVSGTATCTSGTLSCAAAGTVLYTATTPGQNVMPGSYGNLTWSNHAKTLPAGGTVRVAGVFTPGTGSGHATAGSTIEFDGAGSQSIPALGYGNLASSGSGARVLPSSGVVRVTGTFTPGSNAYTITGSTIEYEGTGPQTLPAGFPTYHHLVIDNPSGVTLGTDVTVNGVLTLDHGMLTTGPSRVSIGSTGSVSRNQGWVNGILRKPIGSGAASPIFEIGSPTGYTPVSLTFANITGTGTLTASTTEGDHPQLAGSGIDDARSVNRYWTLTPAGVVFDHYDVLLTFLPGDVDGAVTPGAFTVQTYNAPVWNRTDGASVSPTVVEAKELTSFSDFAAGELEVHTLAASAGPNGSIDPTGDVPATDGTWHTFTITPDAHHHILDVVVDGLSVGAVETHTFNDVTADHTIAATFALTTHTIAVTAGSHGSIDPTGAVVVADGSDRTFAITPDLHYHVLDVLADGVSIGPVITHTFTDVTADHTLEATFELTTHVIGATAGSNGSIDPAGAVVVADGDDRAFTITAGPNHHIDDVLVDGASVGPVAAYTFTGVTGAHTISASFAIDTYTITPTAGAGGSIDPSGPVTIAHGGDRTFTVTPDLHFHVVDVQVDGVSQGPLSAYTFTAVDASHTIAATFAIDTYTITATAGPDGSVSPSGAFVVPAGSSQGFDIAAAPGSFLVDVQVDGVSIGRASHHDFTGVLADHSLEATFRRNDVLSPLMRFRADQADGSVPRPNPGAVSPWIDLIGDHDAALSGFTGTPASGWKGEGTLAKPHRLHWSGREAAIVNGSVPDLQNLDPITAELWFRTGFDGPAGEFEYLLEWSDSTHAGMSIALYQGQLRVFTDPWVDVAPITPATWYHVLVAKEPGAVRVYLNGVRVHAATEPRLGRQISPLAIGASAHGFLSGAPGHADFFRGEIAQMTLWRGAVDDTQALAAFELDRELYLPRPAQPRESVVVLRADRADGAHPYAGSGNGGPWVDLAGTVTSATLTGFDGSPSSGWNGGGSPGSPYRLELDGIDDRATIPAGAVAELIEADSVTAEMWFRPRSIPSSGRRYLLEWLQGFGHGLGMAISIADGQVQLDIDRLGWIPIAPVNATDWHHLVVTKGPGEVHVYINGAPAYDGMFPAFGEPNSPILLGASTRHGPNTATDFFDGAIAQVCLRAGMIGPAEAAASFGADAGLYYGVLAAPEAPRALALAGARPNPSRSGNLNVSFALPGAGPATIELIDVGGRRVAVEEVGSMGPGQHTVRLGQGRDLQPGLYWVRLKRGAQAMTSKVTIVR